MTDLRNFLKDERASNLDELENGKPGTIKTDKDTCLEADMVFKFVGAALNTEAYKDGLGKYSFNRHFLEFFGVILYMHTL